MIKFNSGYISFAGARSALFGAMLLVGSSLQPSHAAHSGVDTAEPPASHVADFAKEQDVQIGRAMSVGGSAVVLGGVKLFKPLVDPQSVCWNRLGAGVSFEKPNEYHRLILVPPAGYTSATIEFVGVKGDVKVFGGNNNDDAKTFERTKSSSENKPVPAGNSTIEISWSGLIAPGAFFSVQGADKDAKFTVKSLTLKR